MAPLSSLIKRKKIALDKTEEPDDTCLLSIGFSGEITRRDGDLRLTAGNLFKVEPGDIVYSKIDVRNGAIGQVPSSIPSGAVTAEFPVYLLDEDVARPDYVTVLFRSERFRLQLQSMVSGTSGRKRINPEQLENTLVPLPTLDQQDAMLEEWRGTREQVEEAQAALTRVAEDLDRMLRERSSQEALDGLERPALAVAFNRLGKWDVASQKAEIYLRKQRNTMFLNEIAQEATVSIHPASDPEHLWSVFGVSNRDGVVFSHYQEGREFNSPYKRISSGWFFHNPTRANVGSLGRVPEGVSEDAITSPEYQVWRPKDPENADFLEALLKTKLLRELIRVNRSGGVKQRLYVSNLLSIGIPRVSQEEMVQVGLANREALERLRSAKNLHEEARLRLETVIEDGIVN